MSAYNSTFQKIKVMANRHRFQILQLAQAESLSIVDLSKRTKLSYTKTADYVTLLEKQGLITKSRKGKEILVTSTVVISDEGITFSGNPK